MRRCFRSVTAFVLAGSRSGGGPAALGRRRGRAGRAASFVAADDLAQLKRDLDALRQDYADRVAAIESRIAALEGRTAAGGGARRPRSRAPAAGAPPRGRPPAPLRPPPPVRGRGLEGLQPRHRRDRQLRRRRRQSPGGGEPSLNMQESELSFQAVVDPVRARRLLRDRGPGRGGARGGLHHLPDAPRRLPREGRQDARRLRQGGRAARPRAPVRRPAARHEEPARRRGRPRGRRASPSPASSRTRGSSSRRPARSTRATPRSSRRPTRGDLAYVGHLRAYRDLGESTNLDLGGSIAYGHNGVTADTTTRLLGVDATLRWKPLRRSIYTHFLARGELDVEPARGRWPATQDAVGGYGYLEYQFGRRWTAGVRYDNSERADDPGRPRQGRLVHPHATGRASSAWSAPSTAARRFGGRTSPAQRAPLPVPVRDRRPRRPSLLIEVAMRLLSDRRTRRRWRLAAAAPAPP